MDYVIIMGYDEHYVGSGEDQLGRLSSMGGAGELKILWRKLRQRRVINAVPFYSRLWKTLAGTLSSEAIGMGKAQEVVTKYNVETSGTKIQVKLRHLRTKD